MNDLLQIAVRLIDLGFRAQLHLDAKHPTSLDTEIEALRHVAHNWRQTLAAQQQHDEAESE